MSLLAAARRRSRGNGYAYRYMRLYTAASGGLYIDEAGFFASASPGDYLTAADLTFGRSANYLQSGQADSGSKGQYAFDDSLASAWGAYAGGGPFWVGIDLGSVVTVGSYRFKVGYAAPALSILIQGSNDASAWTTLATEASCVTGNVRAAALP